MPYLEGNYLKPSVGVEHGLQEVKRFKEWRKKEGRGCVEI